MLHPHPAGIEKNSDHVEPVGIIRFSKAICPDLRRPTQLSLLSPVHTAKRAAEIRRPPRLHFHKCNDPAGSLPPGRNKINIPVTRPKTAVQYRPALRNKPLLGNALSPLPEFLPLAGHSPSVGRGALVGVVSTPREESISRPIGKSTNAHGFPRTTLPASGSGRAVRRCHA